ncbi:hypothetical protein FXO38_33736 [Capsicum annuum]|nr:hypothetical protein FXO37_35454 [Capsicum annuum]KAF3617854.1 hypothetical protein FXO38_33736 [Capsicum annuum]
MTEFQLLCEHLETRPKGREFPNKVAGDVPLARSVKNISTVKPDMPIAESSDEAKSRAQRNFSEIVESVKTEITSEKLEKRTNFSPGKQFSSFLVGKIHPKEEELVVDSVADIVDYWITFNEPHVFCMLTYCAGAWPGGNPDMLEVATSALPIGVFNQTMNWIAIAHSKAYDYIHEKRFPTTPYAFLFSIQDQVYARRQGMTKVVAGLILDNYVDTKRIYTPNDIVSDMMREHVISLDYHQARLAKIKEFKMLCGDPIESYQKIPVDGAALKSLYDGTMLTASMLDPGGHILPLAYAVKSSNEFLHTVSNDAKRFIVCLRSKKCSCGEFQLDEIPCSHAMAAITYRNQHGENYCSPYYNNKNFRDAYAIPVEPLPCEST